MVKSFKNHLLRFKKSAGLDFFNKDGLDKFINYLHRDCGLEDYFALSYGVPPDVVMKFTGHSDYKSMKPYIDITESAKRDAISLMEKAFDAK